jgi:hypothetical protein
VRATPVAALVLAAAVTACTGGSGSHPPASTTPSGALTSTTRPASRGVTAPSPTAPATTVALIPQETPELAARALLTAWSKGDRHGALQVASPAAVAALFAVAAESFSDRGCQDPLNGQSSCAYGLGGDTGIAQITTVSLAGGWVVQSVSVNPG